MSSASPLAPSETLRLPAPRLLALLTKSLPPVADRELRRAARQRSTFWVRVVAALVAVLIGSGLLVLSIVPGTNIRAASLGQGLFATLTWLSVVPTLLAGLFFTSDSLSQEKREGTLGFLFLTDLRGYDVVLGKLLATSLRGVCALLAIFPILAITLLLGGVDGAAFWKTMLALINALLVSLAAGLFASSISRDAQKALAATMGLLMVLLVAGPIADALSASLQGRNFTSWWTCASPLYPFLTADDWGRSPFWITLLVNQVILGILLGSACWLTPRTWQDKPARKRSSPKTDAAKPADAERRQQLRGQLLQRNPVWWLIYRERFQKIGIWTIAILSWALFGLGFAVEQVTAWELWPFVCGMFNLVIYVSVTSQAGRFLIEARRSGLLELLLATPLTVREIIHGQWIALLRMFGLPLGLFVVVQIAGISMVRNASLDQFLGALLVIPNLLALVWVAMWSGLRAKRPNLNTLKVIVLVLTLPWFVFAFSMGILGSMRFLLSGAAIDVPEWAMKIVYCLLFLGKDLAFFWWARHRLQRDFRSTALQIIAPAANRREPPVLPPRQLPPPLTAA